MRVTPHEAERVYNTYRVDFTTCELDPVALQDAAKELGTSEFFLQKCLELKGYYARSEREHIN